MIQTFIVYGFYATCMTIVCLFIFLVYKHIKVMHRVRFYEK